MPGLSDGLESGDTVANVEFETPVKGPKQVHKLLPRPAGARLWVAEASRN